MAGFRACMLALLISGGLAAPLQADLKIRVQETFGRGGNTSLAYYRKEHFWRTESPGDRGYMIVDWVNKRSIAVDPALRQYVVHTQTRKPEATDLAETVVVDIETRDRGEQRQMFGHAARRFITTERRHIEYRDRPPSDITEIVTDGWYLDIPGQLPTLSRVGSVHVLAAISGQHDQPAIPKVKVTRSGLVYGCGCACEADGQSRRRTFAAAFNNSRIALPSFFGTPVRREQHRRMRLLQGQRVAKVARL